MNKWHDDITPSDLTFTGMNTTEFARSSLLTRLLSDLSNRKISLGVSHGTVVDTFSVLTQNEDVPNIIEHLMVDMLATLICENPKFIEDYIEANIGRKLQKAALEEIAGKFEIDDLKKEPPFPFNSPWSNELNKLKNEQFNFWWDYEDDEVVIFAEYAGIDGEICRIFFEDEYEQQDAENEAERIIQKLYNDEVNIGDFIKSDQSLILVDDLPEYIKSWINRSSTMFSSGSDDYLVWDSTNASSYSKLTAVTTSATGYTKWWNP
jgi:hypothetical protein